MSIVWGDAREDVRGMIADLIHKEIVKYVEFVKDPNQVSGPTYLILTDAGRRVVAQIDDANRKRTEVTSPAPEIKVGA